MVRVRIAPAPTGFLHVGHARTALYNWVFARQNGGEFKLRIEDTDVERSRVELIDVIFEALRWLGLDWDGEPWLQSKRFDIYRKYVEKLLSEGKAYKCYCTEEELKERRRRALSEGRPWKYDRKCLGVPEQDKPYVVRFRIPDDEVQVVEYVDIVHGRLRKRTIDLEDFVIQRSDGTPTYNLACVVDDHEMGITHVIRGEDHISNTFKQILLYRALGWEVPEFAHLPLILGPDRTKLSKRHGAVSVLQYREEGFLPEAMVNFIALLGWSPGGDREIISREEMIREFRLEKVIKRGAVFDIQKLRWMNKEYIAKSDDRYLLEQLRPFLKEWGVEADDEYVLKVIRLLKTRCYTLREFWGLGGFFFKEPEEYDEEGVRKYFEPRDESVKLINMVMEGFKKLERFDAEGVEQVIRGIASRLGIKAGRVIHLTRLAVSGRTVGPGLFEMLEVLGKERTLRYLNKAKEYLSNPNK